MVKKRKIRHHRCFLDTIKKKRQDEYSRYFN